jgi:hypothetical protein
MIITPWLVATYLHDVTDVWAANDPMPPKDVEDYGGLVHAMGERAARVGELDALRVGIEYLLAHPEINPGPLVAQVLLYNEDDARALLAFVHGFLWPAVDEDGEPVPPKLSQTDVEWREMPLPAWRALSAAERGPA